MPAAVPIVLSAAERHRLKQLARSYTLPLRLVLRASIVRLAAAGRTNASIADRLNVKVDTVRKWRARFAARRLDGLADAPRSGRPPRFSALQRAEVTALACQVPATSGVPLARWSCPELAAQLTDTGVVPAISAATVRRILREDAIKPLAVPVLDLSARPRLRRPGGPGTRALPAQLAGPGARRRRVRHQCRREDLHPGPVPVPPHRAARAGAGNAGRARLRPRRRAGLLRRLRRPSRQGDRPVRIQHRHCGVPGSGRAGHDPRALCLGAPGVLGGRQRLVAPGAGRGRPASRALADLRAGPHPGARVVAQPGGDLLSIVQRKVVTPNDFTDLAEIATRLAAFEQRYNARATPFGWRFTTADLDNLLNRLDQPEHPVPANAA